MPARDTIVNRSGTFGVLVAAIPTCSFIFSLFLERGRAVHSRATLRRVWYEKQGIVAQSSNSDSIIVSMRTLSMSIGISTFDEPPHASCHKPRCCTWKRLKTIVDLHLTLVDITCTSGKAVDDAIFIVTLFAFETSIFIRFLRSYLR
jgi:hypothetical protein